jgi:hypothetical protein
LHHVVRSRNNLDLRFLELLLFVLLLVSFAFLGRFRFLRSCRFGLIVALGRFLVSLLVRLGLLDLTLLLGSLWFRSLGILLGIHVES